MIKNKLKKKANNIEATISDKKEANKAVRFHNYVKIVKSCDDIRKKTEKEAKAYNEDFWEFAKKISLGTFYNEQVTPSFTKEEADKFVQNKYQKEPMKIDFNALSWFPSVHKLRLE